MAASAPRRVLLLAASAAALQAVSVPVRSAARSAASFVSAATMQPALHTVTGRLEIEKTKKENN